MSTEFVVFRDGGEVEWIDPVEGFTETDDAWVVDNGHDAYTIARGPGLTYTIRQMEEN